MKDYLLLKWGTIKGYSFENNWDRAKVQEAIERYNSSGSHSMSVIRQNDNKEQKQALCDLVDALRNCKIQNDWDGKYYTKKQAKDYIMNYGIDD